jgi:uncharacterized protein (TIGR03435 family)
VFACLASIISTASYLRAQEKPVASSGRPADPSQPAKRDYRFEVASLRRVPLTGFKNLAAARAARSFAPSLYREEQVSLSTLAYQGFDLKYGYQMKHPQWMDNEYFTLNATPPEGATAADLPIMIQHLLEDRFGLKYHRETRHLAGYELIVVKSVPGLTKSARPAPDPSTVKGAAFEFKNGMPQFAKDARSVQLCFGAGTCVWHERNHTMQALAEDLELRLQAPLKDATGLEGEYDYTLTFTGEALRGNGTIVSPPPPSTGANPITGGDGASAPMEHPLLRDALEEQLGLKLQPIKNVPVDVIVIDDAEREPTEN